MKGGARAVARLRLAPVSDFLDEQPENVGANAAMQPQADQNPALAEAEGDLEAWGETAADAGAGALTDLPDLADGGRIDGGQERRRSRRMVPMPDPDSR